MNIFSLELKSISDVNNLEIYIDSVYYNELGLLSLGLLSINDSLSIGDGIFISCIINGVSIESGFSEINSIIHFEDKIIATVEFNFIKELTSGKSEKFYQ